MALPELATMTRNWGDTLFGFEGRSNRADFWMVFGLTLLVTLVFTSISWLVRENVVGRGAGPDLALILLGIPVFLFYVWAGTAVTIKRLHDRGKSGQWAWLFIGVPAVASLLTLLFDDVSRISVAVTVLLLGLVILALALWWIIECGILKGTPGPNQYGEDPLDRPAALERGENRSSRPNRPPKPQAARRSEPSGEAPPATTGLANRLFGFSGRLNRQPFWLTSLVCGVAFGILFTLLVTIASLVGGLTVARIVTLLLFLGFYWVIAALYAKRLNDRDRPRWLVIPLLVPSFLILVASSFLVDDTGNVQASFKLENTALAAIVAIAGLAYMAFYIWMLVEVAFLRGTVGDNRHGPDPLEPVDDRR